MVQLVEKVFDKEQRISLPPSDEGGGSAHRADSEGEITQRYNDTPLFDSSRMICIIPNREAPSSEGTEQVFLQSEPFSFEKGHRVEKGNDNYNLGESEALLPPFTIHQTCHFPLWDIHYPNAFFHQDNNKPKKFAQTDNKLNFAIDFAKN